MARAPYIEPKRIRSFKVELANMVPRFPNNRETLRRLEEKSLGGVLVDYLNWAIRYVRPHQREFRILDSALSDPRFELYRDQIVAILAKVRSGEDLTPYLSMRPHTKGYSPNAGLIGPDSDRWSDKDFILNVMGLHHLHLDAMPHNKKRSDDMLFVEITRTTFTLVGIFNHGAFTSPSSRWSDEKDRLWRMFEARATAGTPPGTMVALSPIATSGHGLDTSYRAVGYARKISAMDHLIDNKTFIEKIYADAKQMVPKRPKLKWAAYFQDIGMYDVATRGFFSVCSGPN